MAKKQQIEIEGRTLSISNAEKVLYPAAGFTKAHVIDYYARAAPWLLPHLKDRPVTLKRYPDGVRGEHFYEKDAPGFTPDWVPTFPVPRRAGGADIRYILINDLPTLVWCANLANLELHPFLHRAPKIDQPTAVVFDLDPGPGVDVLDCAEVAFLLRAALERLELECFAKVSGSKGIQVYVPLNAAASYDVTQPFARTLAELLERQHPDRVVSEMAKIARKGKVFIDWSQNSDFKTTVGVYSLRAKRSRPYVSMPVKWEELRKAVKERAAGSLDWEADAALKRLEKLGDLFEPVLKRKQKLPGEIVERIGRGVKARQGAPRSLAPYRAKRDFSQTAEPAPDEPRRSRQGGRRRFVIQKHAASRLHYDFRLEMHDVLKSWAVPKGPPYGQDERRLAMATEDHPVEYLQFEGIIPKGQYGGGSVMVWDFGTYEVIEGNYYKGWLHLFLNGKKLKGEWLLLKDREKGGRNWSLIKAGEAMKPAPALREERSALTGRSMPEIAGAADARRQSHHSQDPYAGELSGLPDAELHFIEPMQGKLAAELPEGPRWMYEIKFDGYRALALKTAEGLQLLSRNRRILNRRFPMAAEALEALEDGTMLDGEVVALDDRGRPSFQILQHHQSTARRIYYYAFDLLAWRGKSLLDLPLEKRREMLEGGALAALRDPVRLSAVLEASAADVAAAAREQGLEGLVAKRRNSRYEPGKRSGAWVKYKLNQSQELVIGGYMPGKDRFQSLLAGYYDRRKLIFIAKVKNGFVPAVKEQVYRRFQGLETDVCPFANLPEPRSVRRGEALTAEVMNKCRWLKPEMVAQVEFTEWTQANHLRHSRFVGLRDDKDPREVTRERPD